MLGGSMATSSCDYGDIGRWVGWEGGREGGGDERCGFHMNLADGVWMNRFHAWQSSLLFSAIFVLHLIFSWSIILSWMLFVVDLGLIGFLTMHAYRDGMSPFYNPWESFGEISWGRTGVLTWGSGWTGST